MKIYIFYQIIDCRELKKASFKENYFVKSVDLPPSTLKFCPVIHEDWFEIKKTANSAISSPFPNRDIG